MAQPFTIDTPTNSVRLDKSREGSVQFTVFNASGRALRGNVKLIAEPAEVLGWLSLDGDAARLFAIAGAEPYRVQVAVPPNTSSGQYTFRLDAYDEANPDASYVQGPTVAFEVPAAATPSPRRFPWWIAALVGVLVLGAVGAFLLWPRTVELPDVRGLEETAGLQALADAGLAVVDPVTRRDDAAVEAAHIIDTVPAYPAAVRRSQPVEVVVSTGPPTVAVPDLTGEEVAAAGQRLLDLGLRVKQPLTQRNDADIPVLHVIRTVPTAAAEVPVGSEVEIVTSIGPPGPRPCEPWPRCLIQTFPLEGQLRIEPDNGLFLNEDMLRDP